MKIARKNVDVKMEIPGATLRQTTGFGDVTGYGKMGAEFFSLSAGVDTTELFIGLHGNLCQCPHWGYVIKGKITTTDSNSKKETVSTDDLFY